MVGSDSEKFWMKQSYLSCLRSSGPCKLIPICSRKKIFQFFIWIVRDWCNNQTWGGWLRYQCHQWCSMCSKVMTLFMWHWLPSNCPLPTLTHWHKDTRTSHLTPHTSHLTPCCFSVSVQHNTFSHLLQCQIVVNSKLTGSNNVWRGPSFSVVFWEDVIPH